MESLTSSKTVVYFVVLLFNGYIKDRQLTLLIIKYYICLVEVHLPNVTELTKIVSLQYFVMGFIFSALTVTS